MTRRIVFTVVGLNRTLNQGTCLLVRLFCDSNVLCCSVVAAHSDCDYFVLYFIVSVVFVPPGCGIGASMCDVVQGCTQAEYTPSFINLRLMGTSEAHRRVDEPDTRI